MHTEPSVYVLTLLSLCLRRPYILSRKCQCVQKILFASATIFKLQEQQIAYVQAEYADVDKCIIACLVYQTVQTSVV